MSDDIGLSHVTVGTNDFARARQFYEPVLQTLGIVPTCSGDEALGFGAGQGRPSVFWVLPPFDGKAAEPGNGPHVAFNAADRAAVDAFYACALANGGSDEGPPGLRPHYHAHYYAAYARDPDGNKLQAVCHEPE